MTEYEVDGQGNVLKNGIPLTAEEVLAELTQSSVEVQADKAIKVKPFVSKLEVWFQDRQEKLALESRAKAEKVKRDKKNWKVKNAKPKGPPKRKGRPLGSTSRHAGADTQGPVRAPDKPEPLDYPLYRRVQIAD